MATHARTLLSRRHRIDGFFSLVAFAGLALYASTVSAGVNVWTTNGPEGGNITALAIDPANPATIYAGTSGGGVFKSSNAGGSWTAINTGLTIPYVNALAIDPSAPATLFAGTSGGGVFKSGNGGESWTAINTGLTSVSICGCPRYHRKTRSVHVFCP